MTRRFTTILGPVGCLLLVLTARAAAAAPDPVGLAITEADRQFWSFRPVVDSTPPVVGDGGWSRNEIDRFVFAKLHGEGLSPAPEADRVTLIRRAKFDLHGLPPAPAEVEAFVADTSPDAYERLIDRLLASPRYGERYARHWLDLVRYAESDGFKQDAYRPNAWMYRDWVIASLNADKPYDQFVREQIAGDELAPGSPDARVATGYLRHGIYEYNQKNAENQWSEYLNDLTDVTGDVFLGLSMACARCHDHKFDPILQTDYFRLRAFFAAVMPRNDLRRATAEELAQYAVALAAWDATTIALREQIADIERPEREKIAKGVIGQFPPAVQEMMARSPAERSPYKRQIAYLVGRQVEVRIKEAGDKLGGEQRERLVELQKQLAVLEDDRPKGPETALCVTDVGPVAPPTYVPGDASKREQQPGYPVVLDGLHLPAPAFASTGDSTGRRTALANWLTLPTNPLSTRVMANRIWQWHFGHGLVRTSSDYGRLGEPPTHPELLDWLTTRFVRGGWVTKPMHRIIMTSATYRQASTQPVPEIAKLKDPENRWLWRTTSRRLDAEQVRDAVLAASGELELDVSSGPPADYTAPKRTVFTKLLRNTRDPLLDAFDLPEAFGSICDRNRTTSAGQSLLMMNGDWPLKRAAALARRVARESPSNQPAALVAQAFRIAYSRAPLDDEREALVAHMREFGAKAIVSAPTTPVSTDAGDQPVTQVMPQVGGQGLLVRDANPADMLRLPPSGSALLGDAFSVEAYVMLDSLYENAEVRVIAAQWNGEKEGQPGWSLGVTSERSQHQPLNLVLQVVGAPGEGRVGGYEVIPSNLRLELHKAYYVGIAADMRDTGEGGVTFWLKDVGDMDAPLRSARVSHRVTGSVASTAPLVVGGRDAKAGERPHGWDGLIGEVRISTAVLLPEQTLFHGGAAVLGHWSFDDTPGPLKESAGRLPDLVRVPAAAADRQKAGDWVRVDPALVDLCHVLLNSNEFLYVD